MEPTDDDSSPTPWWKRTAWRLPVWVWLLVGALLLISVAVDPTADNDETVATPTGRTAAAAQRTVLTCEGPFGARADFYAEAGEECDDVLRAAASAVPEALATPGSPAALSQPVSLCETMQGSVEVTYSTPEYGPLINALLAGVCPGDRSRLVFSG